MKLGEAVDEPDNDPSRPFISFTQDQRVATRRMMRHLESLINVEFVEVSDTSVQLETGFRGGVMRFGNYTLEFDTSLAAAFAFLPGAGNLPQNGDQWFNSFYTPIAGPSWERGGSSYTTMLHEMGHAMGLLHPFVAPGDPSQKPRLPEAQDSDSFTVMSYTGSANFLSPWGFQLYDIANLQETYGAAQNNLGDDVYGIDYYGADDFFLTIWDTGGNDTISAEGSFIDSTVDLRAGQFSSIGIRRDNLAVAFEVEIENAIGSDNNDILNGNELANVITGNNGDDVIQGFGADDSLFGGAGNDTYIFGMADGSDRINENRGAGVDAVTILQFPGVDNFEEDLSFRREGRDLVIDLTVDDSISQGSITVSNQQWGSYRVESLNFGAVQVDLKELFAQVGPTNTRFRVLSESTTYGFLTVPV